MDPMHVSKTTPPKQLAGAIFNAVQEQGEVPLLCIGNGAVGQAVKGFIVAKGFFAQRGIAVEFDPNWDAATVPDKGDVVAIKIVIRRKR